MSYRSLAHAARAHIQGERVDTPAPKSLAHSAHDHIEEQMKRPPPEPLPIRPKSLTHIAGLITGRINEADNVGEKGIIASTNPEDAGPPQEEPKAKDKKKKGTPNPDDPDAIALGVGNPVDLAPTTDNPATVSANDKKDKRVVEAAGVHEAKEEKTFPRGIQLGNYHRNIRARVMKIMATNQNLVKKHGIIPAEPKEEVELDEAGFDPFKATGQLVQMYLLGGHHYDRRRNYHKKQKSSVKKIEAPEPHPLDDKPLPKIPTMRTTNKGKSGLKASDAIARYREKRRRGLIKKEPLFHPDGSFNKIKWTESVE